MILLCPDCRVLLSKDPSAGDHLEKNFSNILTALIHYFREPEELGLSHDDYQHLLCSLRERQNLFNKQVSGGLVRARESRAALQHLLCSLKERQNCFNKHVSRGLLRARDARAALQHL